MPESSLQTLLDRRAAFLAFVQRRVGDRSLAEDIVQAAYVRAIEHTGTLREEQSMTAWFFSVLRNAIVDHYRRNASESSAMDKWAVELGLSADAPERAAPEAEVNKFVVLAAWLGEPDLRASATLRRRLYEDVAYAHDPSTEHGHRYRLANVRAHTFVRGLERQYLEARRWGDMRAALRRFYRMGQTEKRRLAA